MPSVDGAVSPTETETLGRGRRVGRHQSGRRTTNPASSYIATSQRKRWASRGVQDSGW